jgi:DNA invertase Pin-like site-specific DNA recombinase
MNNIYNVGLYIRLSREDDDKNYESESITNQKSLLLQYAKENNLRVYDIYIDDGFSGTNFDRPGFKRLIQDI